jgi:NADPH-dependent curcumin reductase CurA
MAPANTKCIVLAERPGRGPVTNRTFKPEVRPLPAAKDGDVVVKTEYVSIVSHESPQRGDHGVIVLAVLWHGQPSISRPRLAPQLIH